MASSIDTLKRQAYRIARGLRRRLGWQPPVVAPTPPVPTTRRPMRGLDEFCAFMISRGVIPKTVVDVGAAWGTQELLKAFPEAYHILIDPVPRYEARLQTLVKKYRGEYHLVALSDTIGEMPMEVIAGAEDRSTLWPAGGENTMTVPVTTMDALLLGRELERPILVKTDCQGYDMHVMRGGREFLKHVDIAVCETFMFHPPDRLDLPDFGDTVLAMRDLGFAVYDIVSYQTRPFDDALGYVDIIFAREDSAFRRHHRWA